jgi:hypothetical protein
VLLVFIHLLLPWLKSTAKDEVMVKAKVCQKISKLVLQEVSLCFCRRASYSTLILLVEQLKALIGC